MHGCMCVRILVYSSGLEDVSIVAHWQLELFCLRVGLTCARMCVGHGVCLFL